MIFLAKLCNQDTPVAIADWAKNHAEELVELLKLRQSWMPHHNTYRRVFQEIISEAEFGQLMQKYHQQPTEEGEDTLAMDGKTLRGTWIADQERGYDVLSVYAGQSQRVVAQEVVDIKENEIVAAPKALEQVSVAGKIITATPCIRSGIFPRKLSNGRRLSVAGQGESRASDQDIQCLFTPESPSPDLAKSPPISKASPKSMSDMAGSKTYPSNQHHANDYLIGLGWDRCIAWNARSSGGPRAKPTKPVAKSSTALPVFQR